MEMGWRNLPIHSLSKIQRSGSEVIIIQQDCIIWMNSQIEKSIDCVITSPPYNLNIKYPNYKDDLPRESYLKWMLDVSKSIKRILKDDGHLFLNIGYSNIDPWIAMDVAQVFRSEFILQNNITWIKHLLINNQTEGLYKPISSNRFISPTNESIFHFTKTGNISINREAIGHRNITHKKYPDLYTEGRHIAEHRRKIARCLGFKTYIDLKNNSTDLQKIEFEKRLIELNRSHPWDQSKKKCIGNTWFIPYKPTSSQSKKGHPAVFPEQLPDMCIKLSGIPKGSKIYDPFCGTGTTIRVAESNNMIAIGTDIQ